MRSISIRAGHVLLRGGGSTHRSDHGRGGGRRGGADDDVMVTMSSIHGNAALTQTIVNESGTFFHQNSLVHPTFWPQHLDFRLEKFLEIRVHLGGHVGLPGGRRIVSEKLLQFPANDGEKVFSHVATPQELLARCVNLLAIFSSAIGSGGDDGVTS